MSDGGGISRELVDSEAGLRQIYEGFVAQDASYWNLSGAGVEF